MENRQAPIKNDHPLIHCKQCKGPLVKDLKTEGMEGVTSFTMKCPHCKQDVVITISISKHPSVDVDNFFNK